MNATQFVRQQVAEARSLNEAAMAGLTDAQFNWLPPGTIHPIKSAFLHAVAGEDLFFQSILQGQPPLWATGGWAGRIGLAQAPGGGQGWEKPIARCWRWLPCWRMPKLCATPPMNTWRG